MSENSPQEELKRYIFHEMSEEEYDAVEERYFDDPNYFDELAELENDLVDRYAKGILRGTDLARFEQSIDKVPGRKNKIVKAHALQNLIGEEIARNVHETEPGFWAKLSNFFNPKTFVFQYAAAGLAVLLICVLGYVLYQNRLVQQELARQRDAHRNEIAAQERNIQNQLNELNRQLEEEKRKSDSISIEQDKLLDEKEALEKRLASLQKEKTGALPQPVLATTMNIPGFLLPGSGRGGSQLKIITIKPETTRINLNLEIPPTYSAETFDVNFNGKSLPPVKRKPSKTRSGKRFLNITIPVQNSGQNEQTISIFGNDGSEETYVFRLKRNK